MANSFVKFQRGTKAAYDALVAAGNLDNNTLYFIYAEDNASTGSLYLGNRVISGGDITIASATLNDLSDVVIEGAGTNSFLTLNADGKWVNTTANEVANLILSARTFDERVFVESDAGVVALKGYDTAEAGTVPSKGADGNIAWVKPANEEIQALQTAVGVPATEGQAATGLYGSIVDLEAALNGKVNTGDVYTKAETDKAIADAGHLKRAVVDVLPEKSAADPNTIYMIPLEGGANPDVKAEYMLIENEWEKIGDTTVDLSGYATTQALTDGLAGKVDIVAGSRLMTDSEGTKLAGIADGAEVNVINAVSDDFTIGENRTLTLNNIAVSKVTDLETLLNAKASQTDLEALQTRMSAAETQLTWTEMVEPTAPTV